MFIHAYSSYYWSIITADGTIFWIFIIHMYEENIPKHLKRNNSARHKLARLHYKTCVFVRKKWRKPFMSFVTSAGIIRIVQVDVYLVFYRASKISGLPTSCQLTTLTLHRHWSLETSKSNHRSNRKRSNDHSINVLWYSFLHGVRNHRWFFFRTIS